MLVLLTACTKEIDYKTEVEFEVIVEHKANGNLDEDLTTVITVVPEAVLEEFSYSYSYAVLEGEGHFNKRSGERLPKGEAIALSPFSASLNYVGTETGNHSIKVTAMDNYGFTQEVDIVYTLTAIPPVESPPTETPPVVQPEPGSAENDILTFMLPGQTDATKIDVITRTVAITVPFGTVLNVAPSEFGISPEAKAAPSETEEQDFGNPVNYSVTAENGEIQVWTVEVTIALKPNDPPMVDAGAKVIVNLPADTATLSGNATDDNGIISTVWTQESGNSTIIEDSAVLITELTGLIAGDYVFRLTATDDDGATDTDTVTVRVNNLPTADAGNSIYLKLPQTSVSITGQANDVDGTFSTVWTVEENDNPVTIVSPNSLTTEITGLEKGIYVFRLTVTDNDGATSFNRMFVEVQDP